MESFYRFEKYIRPREWLALSIAIYFKLLFKANLCPPRLCRPCGVMPDPRPLIPYSPVITLYYPFLPNVSHSRLLLYYTI